MSRIATIAAATLLVLGPAAGHVALAAEGALEPIGRSWPHAGLFGTYDRPAAQRGLQVYREVCSVCHSLDYIAFHNLTALGLSEDATRSLASEYTVSDGPDDEGEMFERPGQLTDHFPPPYPNEQAARAANGGALPPDLSLLTKARPEGTDYLVLVRHGDPAARSRHEQLGFFDGWGSVTGQLAALAEHDVEARR